MTKADDFEKQFPSIKWDDLLNNNGRMFVPIELMQKNCRDNERVREAIEQVGEEHGINTEGKLVYDDEDDVDGHLDEDSVACWQCALMERLGM